MKKAPILNRSLRSLEHLAGIEPVWLAWEASALPLNYRCMPKGKNYYTSLSGDV